MHHALTKRTINSKQESKFNYYRLHTRSDEKLFNLRLQVCEFVIHDARLCPYTEFNANNALFHSFKV